MPDSPPPLEPDPTGHETAPQGEVETASPFTPRPADSYKDKLAAIEPASLPPAKNLDKLRLATADMVEFGITLDHAAQHHGVDSETLHVWYRTYVNYAARSRGAGEGEAEDVMARERGGEFDRKTSRQFDMNWAGLVFRAERERPQLSPLRRRLIDSPLTGWIFQGDVVDKVAISGAAAVVGLGILAVVVTARHRGSPDGAEVPPPVQAEPGGDLAEFDLDQKRVIFERIVQAIGRFISLETWEERLPYVRSPGRVLPLIEQYYQQHADGPLGPVEMQKDLGFIQRGGRQFALMHGQATAATAPRRNLIFLIELTDGDPEFLFDWEVLVNYEPQPWEEFSAARSMQPAPFRVRLSKGDYYNGAFIDQGEFASFSLKLLDREDQAVFGYAPRGSETEKRISRAIASQLTGSCSMVVRLRFPEGARFDNLVEIESIVRESW